MKFLFGLIVSSVLLIGCGPSAKCQEECKDVVDKFGCTCKCDPYWKCGNFDQEDVDDEDIDQEKI